LAEALTRLASAHAREECLSEAVVLGALTLVLGRAVGAMARDGEYGLDEMLQSLVRHLRRVAVAEFTLRPYTIH
jgi:hypothetical protein